MKYPAPISSIGAHLSVPAGCAVCGIVVYYLSLYFSTPNPPAALDDSLLLDPDDEVDHGEEIFVAASMIPLRPLPRLVALVVLAVTIQFIRSCCWAMDRSVPTTSTTVLRKEEMTHHKPLTSNVKTAEDAQNDDRVVVPNQNKRMQLDGIERARNNKEEGGLDEFAGVHICEKEDDRALQEMVGIALVEATACIENQEQEVLVEESVDHDDAAKNQLQQKEYESEEGEDTAKFLASRVGFHLVSCYICGEQLEIDKSLRLPCPARFCSKSDGTTNRRIQQSCHNLAEHCIHHVHQEPLFEIATRSMLISNITRKEVKKLGPLLVLAVFLTHKFPDWSLTDGQGMRAPKLVILTFKNTIKKAPKHNLLSKYGVSDQEYVVIKDKAVTILQAIHDALDPERVYDFAELEDLISTQFAAFPDKSWKTLVSVLARRLGIMSARANPLESMD